MSSAGAEEPYRGNMHRESEKNTVWRHGAPPCYTEVNALFVNTQTKVWGEGSLEETVQNLVKMWEMELSHKTQVDDFKTIDPHNFSLKVKGNIPHSLPPWSSSSSLGYIELVDLLFVSDRVGLSAKETSEMGSYNALLQTSLPEEIWYCKPSMEMFDSSHDVFRRAFPGGLTGSGGGVHRPSCCELQVHALRCHGRPLQRPCPKW
ncbi:hypothetical protein KI387_031067 [Taxus chinensis]|uniref:Uncharacterized protein n=1 Tax=Taxus chinensis TaxID=29808 RepID=A0AA38CFS0_TAXCH|nr:hypothetical protein KI387_031067 [Taxus chinensis]